MDLEIQGMTRGSTQNNFSEGDSQNVQLNNRGEILVTHGIPPLASLVNLGNSYQARTTSAATPVTSIPTTACLLAIWNGEPDNGKHYIIDSVYAFTVVGTGSQQVTCILGNMSLAPILVMPTGTLVTPKSLRAGNGYRGLAKVSVGPTLNAAGTLDGSGIAANWFPIGTTCGLAGGTNSIGACTDVDCRGMFIVPPKAQFGLHALTTTGTSNSIQIGMRWHEVILPPIV